MIFCKSNQKISDVSTLITKKINIAIHIFWHWECEKDHMHRHTHVGPRYLIYIGCYMKKVFIPWI